MQKREWGAESNGKLPPLFIPGKTTTLVPKSAVEDLPLGKIPAFVPRIKKFSLKKRLNSPPFSFPNFTLRLLSHIPAFCRRRQRLRHRHRPVGFHIHRHAGTVGQFVFFSDRREMCPHINRRYLLGLMFLRRRHRKRAREYRVHPLLTVRYMEGSFYTLFVKLRNHDSKFYNYFCISIHTFDFLVDRVTNSVLLFFLILVKKLLFQKCINFSPSLLFFYFVFKTISGFVP